MMGHPNEELVRSGYDAFAKGDIDTLRVLFDPEVVWHQPGRSVLAGVVAVGLAVANVVLWACPARGLRSLVPMARSRLPAGRPPPATSTSSR